MNVDVTQFMQEAFRDLPAGAAPVVAGFRGDPHKSADADWRPHAVNGHLPEVIEPDANCYYSIASIRPDETGAYLRRKQHIAAVHVIVLDDVGSNGKVASEDILLPPSFDVETSPDNSQYGYLLAPPVTEEEAMPVLKALGLGAAGDKGGQNAARWVRLPIGINGKTEVIELHGSPFPVKLQQWHPERRYTLREIIEGLKLEARMPRDEGQAPHVDTELPTLRALRDAGRVLREELSRPGTWRIKCPWSDEHTGGDITGTYYYEPHTNRSAHEGFLCNHGHCSGRTIRDLRDVLGVASATAHFAEPLDVFAEHDAPPLPPTALPPVIAEFAADRAELIGCDPAAIALPALIVCGAVMPDEVVIQPKTKDSTWRESARLWLACIGHPSSKKSPGLKAACAPAFAINQELATASARELAEFETALAESKRSKAAPPSRPPWRQVVVDDTTVEALADVLIDNPRGVISIKDELSEWVGSMDVYSARGAQKDRPAWLQAFEGGPRALNRVIRGRAVIPNWSCAIVGGIQPDVVTRLLGGHGTGDGLLQRFLVAHVGPATAGIDRQPDEFASAAYRAAVRALYATPNTEAVVRLSPEAGEAWRAYTAAINGVSNSLSTGEEMLASHLGKWPGILARLLLTVHAVIAVDAGMHPADEFVSRDTAERVIKLAKDYLFPHAASFYSDVLGQRSHHASAQKVAEIILARQWQAFTARDIAAQWKGWRGFNAQYCEAVLVHLELYNWIWPVEPQARTGRRPSERYAVNPAVHERFRAHAARETARRQQLRADWMAAARG